MRGRRPSGIFMPFALWEKNIVSEDGRIRDTYKPTDRIIHAVMGDAKAEEISRWKQRQHPISHTLVQNGCPKAREGDMLKRNGRAFFVQGVNNIGDMDAYTVYYVEERYDENRTG